MSSIFTAQEFEVLKKASKFEVVENAEYVYDLKIDEDKGYWMSLMKDVIDMRQ